MNTPKTSEEIVKEFNENLRFITTSLNKGLMPSRDFQKKHDKFLRKEWKESELSLWKDDFDKVIKILPQHWQYRLKKEIERLGL